jgi:hypothetical protein
MKIKCNICGTELNQEELEIYYRISDVDTICYCDIAKEISQLRKRLEVMLIPQQSVNKQHEVSVNSSHS